MFADEAGPFDASFGLLEILLQDTLQVGGLCEQNQVVHDGKVHTFQNAHHDAESDKAEHFERFLALEQARVTQSAECSMNPVFEDGSPFLKQ